MEKITEIIFVIDCSGSMAGLEADTIGGFNSLIEKQKRNGCGTFVSTFFFNHETNVVHKRVDIQNVKKLTHKDYICMGSTALLDAVGNAITTTMQKQSDDMVKVDNTLFVIITDGYENSSREFSYSSVKTLIDNQTKNGWEFLFLGANIDAVKEGSRLGIKCENAVNYKNDKKGVKCNYDSVSCALDLFREEGELSAGWRKEIDDYFDN